MHASGSTENVSCLEVSTEMGISRDELFLTQTFPDALWFSNVGGNCSAFGSVESTTNTSGNCIIGELERMIFDSSPEANMRKALRIFAKTPTALAAFYRIRKGKKIIKPKKTLTFAENFFYMCFGKVPQKEIVKAFDVSLILYAEHSFNVSTFTARTITSSLSDIHGAITGAIASLKGPLHGGANEEVMHMMNKIKKPENALKWINNALKNKEVVMGFGHRVYK